MKLERRIEREFARAHYVHLYRKGHSYHGAHPFYMYYWGENGRQHVGKVIAAGAENNHVPAIMGWDHTDTLSEAIEEARGFMGRSASISFVHLPPIFRPTSSCRPRRLSGAPSRCVPHGPHGACVALWAMARAATTFPRRCSR